jgi:O-antigen/teichoic acid export membrane protein
MSEPIHGIDPESRRAKAESGGAVKGGARRAGWGLLDQILSSATNFALGIFIAATVSPNQFGAFFVVYGAYGVCLGISSGVASTPLIVRFSAADGTQLRQAERSSVGTALAVGLLGGAACLFAAAFIGSDIAGPLRAVGAMLPGLLVQDAWRFAFMARGAPRLAAANDSLWAALQVGGTSILLAADAVSASSMALVWGGSATVAACFGCIQAKAWPALASSRRWLRDQRDLGLRYAVEAVAHRSGAWLAVAAVGAIAGLPAVAALRGATLLVTGPLSLLFVGAAFVGLPEAVRLFESSPDRLPRMVWGISIAVTGLTACWCTLVLALSDTVGSGILGETWPLAKPLLLTLTLFAVAQAIAIGPAQGLWALAAARRSLKSQLANVFLVLATMSVGAGVDGARGAAVGLVGAAIVSTLIWWQQFGRAFAEAMQTSSARAAEPTSGRAAMPPSAPPPALTKITADGYSTYPVQGTGGEL